MAFQQQQQQQQPPLTALQREERTKANATQPFPNPILSLCFRFSRAVGALKNGLDSRALHVVPVFPLAAFFSLPTRSPRPPSPRPAWPRNLRRKRDKEEEAWQDLTKETSSLSLSLSLKLHNLARSFVYSAASTSYVDKCVAGSTAADGGKESRAETLEKKSFAPFVAKVKEETQAAAALSQEQKPFPRRTLAPSKLAK